jgi:hypothetical protein
MAQVLPINLTQTAWESPCHLCRRPMFYGETAYVLQGHGMVCCSSRCIQLLKDALERLNQNQR